MLEQKLLEPKLRLIDRVPNIYQAAPWSASLMKAFNAVSQNLEQANIDCAYKSWKDVSGSMELKSNMVEAACR